MASGAFKPSRVDFWHFSGSKAEILGDCCVISHLRTPDPPAARRTAPSCRVAQFPACPVLQQTSGREISSPVSTPLPLRPCNSQSTLAPRGDTEMKSTLCTRGEGATEARCVNAGMWP